MQILLFALVFFSAISATAYAEELERTQDGVKVANDNYLNIPSDMKVRKVAANVITPEDDADYIARKIDEQNKRLDAMNAKLEAIDSRLKALETT